MVDSATAITSSDPPPPPPASAMGDPPPAGDPPPDPPPAGDPPQSWYSGFEGDLSTNEKLTGFDSVESLAAAYVAMPEALVVPKADEYVLPEGQVPSDFGEFVNGLGMTQVQVDAMLKYQQHSNQHVIDFQDRQMQEGLNTVYQEWGESKDTNLSLARRALKQYDTDSEFAEYLDSSGAGNNPMVVKFLHKLGHTLNEDGFLKSEVNSPKEQVSAADTLYPNQGKPET